MHCINCNNKIPEDAKFCSNCGVKIEARAKSAKVNEKENGHKINRGGFSEGTTAPYGWFFGTVFLIASITLFAKIQIFGALLLLLMAFILIPSTKEMIEKNIQKKIPIAFTLIFIIIGLILSFSVTTMSIKEKEYGDNLKLAKIALENKKYDEALRHYYLAKCIKPNDQEAKIGYENTFKLNEFDKQEKVKQYLLNGNKLLANKNWGQAIEEFNKAIDIDKNIQNKIAAKLKKAHIELNKQEQARKRARAKEQMKYFEGSAVQVAVANAKISKSTSSHTSNGNNRFVWIYVVTKNSTNRSVHVNPNDFSLSDDSNYTVSHDTDTYSLSNYFDAVNLPPNGETAGWLIFYLPKDSKYILHYNGFQGNVDKEIIL